ncbi:hypothetical protein [Novipirellula maiorica]|uniref:hypothetical protein n=1 Tax=Novipirellula maiorica TaxID=1265734 RepID=UPI0011817A7A|nr:hypothetical protein [Rhodopirellula maiorica]
MKEDDWLVLLGENWQACDNNAFFIDFILEKSPVRFREGPIREMMTEHERKVLDDLPDPFHIFRGCFLGVNHDGCSYSLNRSVAKWFASHLAKMHPTAPAILRCGVVNKKDVIAYKDGREEYEVIIRECRIIEDIALDEREWPVLGDI